MSRSKRREEAAFEAHEIGVDGQSVEVELDEEQLERLKVTDALVRGRTYLGRELLTWLLWRSNAGGPILDFDGEPVHVLLIGPLVLRGLAGEATELRVKGVMSPYSAIARRAIDSGLLIHAVRLRITHGERTYEVSVDAEHLALRSARLPDVLSEEEDDRISERLYLVEQLAAIVEALLAHFLALRTSRKWSEKAVPALKEWLGSSR